MTLEELAKRKAEDEADREEARAADRHFDALADLKQMNDLIRHRVKTVAKRFQTAAYIVGRPGTGKTHIVKETLTDLGPAASWVYRNARMSPAALFQVFEQHADSTVVLDDVPTLFKNKQGMQILMAALGGDPDQPRRITYSTSGKHLTTDFRGGIIAISNVTLTRGDPLADALGSRGAQLNHDPADDLLIAQIRELTRKGYKSLTPDQCRAVAEFVIAESRAADYRLDLRYYGKAVEDYLYSQTQPDPGIWQQLVRSSLRTLAATGGPARKPTRDERTAGYRLLVGKLEADETLTPAGRVERWHAETGLSQAQYYRYRT